MSTPKDASQTDALTQFIDIVATLFMTPLKNSVRQAKLNHGHGIMNGFPTYTSHTWMPMMKMTHWWREAIHNSMLIKMRP
jgi:hypothetical protein